MSAANVTITRIPTTKPTVEDEIMEHLSRDGVVIVTGMCIQENI